MNIWLRRPGTTGSRAPGVSVDELPRDLVFSFPAAAVDAAIEAQGFALAQYSVVASALALGTLVHVMPPELPLPEAHFLAWSGGGPREASGCGVSFVDHQRGEAIRSAALNRERDLHHGRTAACLKPIA